MRKGRRNQNKPFKQSRESENAVERSFGDIRKKLFVGLNKLSRTYERFLLIQTKSRELSHHVVCCLVRRRLFVLFGRQNKRSRDCDQTTTTR